MEHSIKEGTSFALRTYKKFPQSGIEEINLMKHIYIATIFYSVVIMLLKAAILLDWLRIFVPRGQRNVMFWMFHGLIWSNVLFYVVSLFVWIFQCSSRRKIWNPLHEGGSCPFNRRAYSLSSCIINLISDIILFVFPQKIIWTLHIPKHNKVGISLLFAVGILLVCL